MATNWTTPVGIDIWKVISRELSAEFNQNIGASDDATPQSQSQPNGPYKDSLENRRDELVALAIKDVRGAIRSAGRYPLSVTANAVPPEFERHVLNLAAFQFANSTPSLKTWIVNERGAVSALQTFYREALARIDELRKGGSFTIPSDPTGEDYETAISATNLAITGFKWGDQYGDDTDYANGYRTDVNGVQVPIYVQWMNSN